MVKRYALDFRQGKMFEIASGYYVAHDDYATLEAENAKLRDLLRRVTVYDLKLPQDLWRDIEKAIEPGDPGEVGENPGMLADIDQEELRP